MQTYKGAKLLDYLLEQPRGTVLWMNNRQITDLEEFDLFKWYTILQTGNEIHIKEIEFT